MGQLQRSGSGLSRDSGDNFDPVAIADRSEPFSMERHGSYVSLRWHEGVTVTLADVVRSEKVLAELTRGARLGLAVYVRKVVRIDPEAREAIKQGDVSPRIALIGSDPVDAVVAAFAHQSVTETRYFEHEEEAFAWLNQEQTDD